MKYRENWSEGTVYALYKHKIPVNSILDTQDTRQQVLPGVEVKPPEETKTRQLVLL
jgi:hypothetical protein